MAERKPAIHGASSAENGSVARHVRFARPSAGDPRCEFLEMIRLVEGRDARLRAPLGDVGIAGCEDDRQLRTEQTHAACQLEAGHPRHDLISDYQIDLWLRAQRLERDAAR